MINKLQIASKKTKCNLITQYSLLIIHSPNTVRNQVWADPFSLVTTKGIFINFFFPAT